VRHILLHNFLLKLISIGLGALIWFTVHYQVQMGNSLNQSHFNGVISKQRFLVPISVITHPGDIRIFKLSQRQAIVELVGEEVVLRKLTPKDVEVYVDLSNFNARQQTNQVLQPRVPPDVIVSDIQPATITIEQMIQK